MFKHGLNTIVISHKPLNQIILKRLMLIFDRVTILDPSENNFLIPSNVASLNYKNMEITMERYVPLYNGSTYQSDEELLINQFDYALKKGVLKVLNLRDRGFYEKNWLPLRLSYDFDTGNRKLMEMTMGLMEEHREHSTNSAVLRGMFIQPEGTKIYPDIPDLPNIFDNEKIENYAYNIQALSIIGKMNRSLMLAGEYDLIPSFIENGLSRIFVEKFEIAKNNSELNVQDEFYKRTNKPLENVQYLLYKISEEILPDEVLDEIPVRELIIARNNTIEKVIKLRRKLIQSVTFLTERELSYEFFNDVEIFIAKEIEPYINEYSKAFRENLVTFLNISGQFSVGVATYSLSLQQSLNPFLIAALCGISAIVGSNISELPRYIDKKHNKRFQNTYSYFLDMR